MTPLASVAFAPQIVAAAQRHHVDPTLLAAVAAQETGGPGSDSGRNVVGDGGHGHGLFQIDDRWHAFASTSAAMDPAQNADYAAGMLSHLLTTYGGNVRMALSAYNAGSPTATGTTTNWGGTVLGYADSVLAHQTQIAGGAAGSARDAAMADLPDAVAATGGLRTMASLLGTQGSSTSSDLGALGSATASSASSAATADVSSTPPSAPPPPQDSNSRSETALVEDLGNDEATSATSAG